MLKIKKITILLLTLMLSISITACNEEFPQIPSPDLSNPPAIETPDITEEPEEPLDNPDLSSDPVDDTHFGEFTADTMDGGVITDEIFNDYDLTMVNIWATWCSPCVKEMPYLQELYTQLPENVNLVTICSDATLDPDLADEILKDSNAEFQTIIANDEVSSVVLSRIQAFPTSVFVDKNGTVLHAVEGAPNSDDIAGVYLQIINEIMEIINVE